MEEKDGVLHLTYEKNIHEISEDILHIADQYEGHIKGRIGCNFPMTFVRTHFPQHPLQKYTTAEYVIIYKKKDRQTKLHELQHAKYYMDATFRQEVNRLWNALDVPSKKRIDGLLTQMGYPEHVRVDEFQAYYYTEPSLFGKLRMDA